MTKYQWKSINGGFDKDPRKGFKYDPKKHPTLEEAIGKAEMELSRILFDKEIKGLSFSDLNSKVRELEELLDNLYEERGFVNFWYKEKIDNYYNWADDYYINTYVAH